MADSLSLAFLSGDEPFPDIRIHRVEYTDELNAPFSLVVELGSVDPAVDPRAVVGQDVVLQLESEPLVRELRGFVRRMRQKTSVVTAGGGTSLYELTIAPPLWLLSRASGRRIHQSRTSLDIITATLALHRGRVPDAVSRIGRVPAAREYFAQYDESDLEVTQRVLSDEGWLAFFDPTNGGAWTVTDDPRAACPLVPTPVAFRPPTDLVSTMPHALALSARDEITTGAVSLRDYDEGHPRLARSVPYGLAGDAAVATPFPKEDATHEAFSVGRFASTADGRVAAERDLARLQGAASSVTCEINFAVVSGARLVVTDHARADVTGELLVIAAHLSIDDGVPDAPNAAARSPSRVYTATCVRSDSGYIPPGVAKPSITATEPAFVVGDTGDGTVDIDVDGRVLVELLWDRRDLRRGNPTRRVRVSQGWAGANLGFMTLPRIGDEVLVGYLGGDPDQPVVLGRVHNATARPPLDLPEPDRTVSAWRSRTIGGDGYNLVLMDDAPGGERLWLRAERDYRLHVQRNASTLVESDLSAVIQEDASVRVDGHLAVDSGSFEHVSGPHAVRATEKSVAVRDALDVTADTIRIEAGSRIELVCGGTKLVLEAGGATLEGAKATIRGGNIDIHSDGTVDVDGALITLN
jgi:type VI secretion system secreted protein VgrG